MFYVYVLHSRKDRELYIGSTNNLIRRVKEHAAGKATATRLRRPFQLLYYEAYAVESDARAREHSLKLRGRARFQLMRRLKASLALSAD